jgi:hypothetical protein
MESGSIWVEQALALDNALLKRLLKIGARLQALLKAA